MTDRAESRRGSSCGNRADTDHEPSSSQLPLVTRATPQNSASDRSITWRRATRSSPSAVSSRQSMSSAETTSSSGHIGYGIAHNRWLELANVKDISDADYRIACDGMADGWIIFSLS